MALVKRYMCLLKEASQRTDTSFAQDFFTARRTTREISFRGGFSRGISFIASDRESAQERDCRIDEGTRSQSKQRLKCRESRQPRLCGAGIEASPIKSKILEQQLLIAASLRSLDVYLITMSSMNRVVILVCRRARGKLDICRLRMEMCRPQSVRESRVTRCREAAAM